jgi:tRNA(Ile)-lysidine synthase
MSLISRVEQRIVAEKLMNQGDVVVVAVSGGPDSVALLHVLFSLSPKFGWKLVVAHVDHQFRGEESAAEADFVADIAARWAIPCEIGHIDVPAYIEKNSINGQAAARELRYDFLHQVAEKYGAQCIALAHHADDQAETLLMRLIRGTGPSGLTGMPERRREKKVELIRPFLRIYKSEIVQHCRDQNLAFCIDSSNKLRKYFRNQVRLDVIPQLMRYNEHLPESLNRLSEMMKAEDDYMEAETASVFGGMVTADASFCRLSRLDFSRLHVALQRRLIKLILNYLSLGVERFDFVRLEAIRAAILQNQTSNLRLDILGDLSMVREYDEIRFQKPMTLSGDYVYLVALEEGKLCIPEAGVELSFSVATDSANWRESTPRPSSAQEAYFDLDQLRLPLSVRNRAAGDRFEPLGLNGSKKVKDMLIDAKIPPSRREAIPLMVDAAGSILWIPGLRRSKHAQVHMETKRLLHVKQLPYV